MSKPSKKGISLDTLAQGALRELTNGAFQKVAANIYDPNTSETAKRTITIALIIHPGEDRELGDVEIAVKTNLCPIKSVKTRMLFGYDEKNKSGVAREYHKGMAGQMTLEPDEDAEDGDNDGEEAVGSEVVDLRDHSSKRREISY